MSWARNFQRDNPRTDDEKLENFVRMIAGRAEIEGISEAEAEARYVAEMAEHPVA